MFKYVDQSGWEKKAPAVDFDKALKHLKEIRKAGRTSAIVVDAAFKQRA